MSDYVVRRLDGRTGSHVIELRNNQAAWIQISKFLSQSCKKLWKVISRSKGNILLLFAPFAILSGRLQWNPVAIFLLNFLTMIPLDPLLSLATDELSIGSGIVGGLINGVYGRPVDLIVSIVAVSRNEIALAQATMLGTILFNILLVLGASFVSGGIKYCEQTFNSTATSQMTSLMTLASISLVLPAAFYSMLSQSTPSLEDKIMILSHGSAIVLLILYLLYLYFQLRTHADLFDEEQQEHSDQEVPILSSSSAGLAIVALSAVAATCAMFLVDSVNSIVESSQLSRSFLGIIVIPFIGNVAELWTTCEIANRGRMDLVIGLAVGNSMHIALFVTPILVILGWIVSWPMSLHFSNMETSFMFLSIFVVSFLIADGKSNYLKGVMCLALYSIIALAVYVGPDGG